MAKVLLSWSSGKDSAWALHRLRQQPELEVIGLFTTTNEAFGRVAIHGVRDALLRAQAEAAGLPLHVIPLPWPCSNADYEARMSTFVEHCHRLGVTHFAFGDLFLEEVRRYREEKLAGTGITPLFPLWGTPTDALARDMLAAGLKATVSTCDPARVPHQLAGHPFDAALLALLPAGVDPCGEHGEFHTFAWDGPMFRHPVACHTGETIEREGFLYTDLLPGTL
ncbi:hypothetical protein G114_05495 [Aeromonas diversa CDC 2478-85]|uniref:Diphthamide synthase domain-containing protein n=1 Tax=Aeromonas diversa CDC 2478-85 TaxID=1268237 RepID=N9U3F2_9GAMM|nr:hypothetical protein [Aeromonas diversa]ENY72855.1 hypothetical protein G114_05495 [Aeromonas diversa CDC 2478-85]